MSNTKNTLVLGASPNPSRYSYLAIERLKEHGHEVIAVGKRDGIVSGVTIEKELGIRYTINIHNIYTLKMNTLLTGIHSAFLHPA